MREIKFRAWHEINKEMVNFDPVTLANDQYQARALLSLIAGLDESGYVMQYTGLKDKNGTEIYEGDYLEWYEPSDTEPGKEMSTVTKIIFTSGMFYGNGCGSLDRLLRGNNASNPADKAEVIGNIYESPELISGACEVE